LKPFGTAGNRYFGVVMIRKILIVDDSPAARKMMRSSILKNRRYEIMEAANGKEAIEKFTSFRPDITFMDLTMPVLSGYDATKKIKDIDKDAIIIAATADVQPKSKEKIKKLGAYSVISKPARPKLLKATLSACELELKNRSGGE
jgi:two-component system chemotaxis response regulator CheY